MIRKPTVLILGAGASKPYGYALGTKLVEQILARTHPEQGALWPVLTIPGSGYSGELVLEFRNSLEKGRPASIDDFLAANVEFRELGKVCIAAALTVFGPTDEGLKEDADWLEYVWGRLHDHSNDTSEAFCRAIMRTSETIQTGQRHSGRGFSLPCIFTDHSAPRLTS